MEMTAHVSELGCIGCLSRDDVRGHDLAAINAVVAICPDCYRALSGSPIAAQVVTSRVIDALVGFHRYWNGIADGQLVVLGVAPDQGRIGLSVSFPKHN